MLRIVNLEEITSKLLQVPSLVNLQETRDPNFANNVKQWLSELEKILENNRIPAAGSVASLRGVLISAERGAIPAGIEFQGRATGRKIREATAADVIRQASDLVSNVIKRDQERIAEAERITRQLVALAKTKGLIREHPHNNNLADSLKHIWRTMSADPDLSQGTASVEGLIGPNDALIILDRTITSWNK
jgi:hypothetical protein